MNVKITPDIAATVAVMKEQIQHDVISGVVPADVGSFGNLHDYVDANCYGGFCDDHVADRLIEHFGGRDEHEGMPQGMLDYLNAAQEEIDAWIKAGGLQALKEVNKPTLFTVTLDWNPNDTDEGDYCTSVWATDQDTAIRLVAEEMADHQESPVEEGDDQGREDYIQELIDNAGSYAAESVADSLVSTVRDLISGPAGEMSSPARQDFEAIMAILVKYGVPAR